MGNQCCQGNNLLEDKNSITMGTAKDGLSKSESFKTNSVEKEQQPLKAKEEDSMRQFKLEKSIRSHNSKQDYQEGDDRLIVGSSNNPAFEEQSQDRNGPQKFGTKDINEKSVARAGSGVPVGKGSLLKAIGQQGGDGTDSQAAKETGPSKHQHQHQLSLQSKDAGTQYSQNQIGGTQATRPSSAALIPSVPSQGQDSRPAQKKISAGSGIPMDKANAPPVAPSSSSRQPSPSNAAGQQASSSASQNQQRGSASAASLPINSAKQQKKSEVSAAGSSTASSSPISLENNTQKRVSSENLEKGAAAAAKKPSSQSKIAEKTASKKDFTVSAESLIIMKKGSFSNSYKVGEVLGEGAFGQVSKVIHKNTGMVRAMKTIKKSGIIKEEEDRLFAEMNILKNLDHPNILRLIELFQDSKNYYLITEYCSGGELFDKIKSMTNFTEKMAADYMKQILSAVVYCHQNHIVHRDLKPENLLFDSEKKNASIKVIDFGTSRKLEKNKKMSKRLGTPYYIAPEVLEQNYDEKCDVWSCGVILYILLCGYPPFGGRSEDEILKKVKTGKFKFEPEDWDRISDEAKQLINKMLTYDPKKRPSAEQALADSWIQKNAPSNHISKRALDNLSSFQTRSKLKQAILTFIVSQIVSQQDKEELQKTFRELDRDGDGTLSKKELIDGYTSVLGDKDKAALQVERIFEEVDLNRSGKVDFLEFMMAASNKETLLSRAKIEQSFKIFDQDGNGNITQEELSYIMGDIPDDFWKEILDECDTNKDGMIQMNEFVDFLLKKKVPI